jgi:hypothetical protein
MAKCQREGASEEGVALLNPRSEVLTAHDVSRTTTHGTAHCDAMTRLTLSCGKHDRLLFVRRPTVTCCN